MTEKELKKILHRHQLWLEGKEGGEQANLQGADLCRADLCGANLREADLCRANLDFSCWPLWCGSLDVTVDKRIAAQLAYHFCRVRCDDPAVQEQITDAVTTALNISTKRVSISKLSSSQ